MAALVAKRSWFFVVLASIAAVIVAVGFARSFYLSNMLHPGESVNGHPAYPLYIYFHGLVLTLWFALFWVQTYFIASGRTATHRKLGMLGVVLAITLVILSTEVVLRSVARSGADGIPASRLAPVVFSNLSAMLQFAAFVAVAVWFRHRPDIHKRLMALASISMLAPALGRWPGALTMFPVFIVVPHLLMYCTLLGYDIATRRRVHLVSWLGLAAFFTFITVSLTLANSAAGQTWVQGLSQR